MIRVEEALERILAAISILPVEKKKLIDALGQVILEDIYAEFNIPSNDNSAMDGYALKAEDIKGASHNTPVLMKVKGEIPAGKYPRMTVTTGYCVQIMTGGIIPNGADTVVPIEDTDAYGSDTVLRNGHEVRIFQEFAKGSHIRVMGEDILKGELIVNAGKLLKPAEIGVLASQGINEVNVIRRPIVSILATGNELISTKAKLSPGKLYNSNTYAVASQVKAYGGIPKILGIAKDRIENLKKAMSRGLDSDLLITTGGVSVGEYDIVKKVIMTHGEIEFWRVSMKPGRPMTFGSFICDDGRRIPHIGLPGNPVSCMLSFEIFGRPAIYKMMGRKDLVRPIVTAISQDEIVNSDGRRVFARVKVISSDSGYIAQLTGAQGSGILTSMVKANGLAIVPEDIERIRKGEPIKVIMLD